MCHTSDISVLSMVTFCNLISPWPELISNINPRPVKAFLITRTVREGGGGTTSPWWLAPEGRRASRKNSRCVSTRSRDCTYIVFSPRSTFDLVRSGQMTIFLRKMTFLALHAHSGISIYRSGLKPSPTCSLFNSEQDRVLLLYPVATFSIRSASK